MCTVILRVPDHAGEPMRILAVRDEDPNRPWQPLGAWWPEAHPGVVGVRDVRAGGAWLAADAATRRLAVLLNRHSPPVPEGVAPISRGAIVLDAVAGDAPEPTHAVLGFNLVDAGPDGVRVITWDGLTRSEVAVPPGTHMIAHDDLDDPRTARITAWHDAFAAASTTDDAAASASPAMQAGEVADPDRALADTVPPASGAIASGGPAWAHPWLEVLARSAELGATDDRAIIRDNRPLGYPTQSLLLCVASIGTDGVEVEYGQLDLPGHWNPVHLVPPRGLDI
ncbi:hypothetical protein GCM10022240_27030 [Microbacterium kribbense]|uniref:Transport and Golgi organization protein 2 n=1 Tax=Microbacterium kribbense TaxID=433645 RepID=A0ABP7GTX2_9MICO